MTSSSPTTGGVSTGLGVPPQAIGEVVGVAKAYTTRVGEGPFPTELSGETGDTIRKEGGEFGATTGRPRRCGWFDVPLMRRAIQICGVTQIALTKLDVLDCMETIDICTHYEESNGNILTHTPLDGVTMAECRAVYETMPGWQCGSGKARQFESLPTAAQRYVNRLEELVGVRITIVSVGPGRDVTVLRESGFFR